ncbi:unnamed protein product [Sphagnum jensenii]|uniref:tRNA-5-taurinomethyluridine 2-sulfurtransferase n=1 Tax=Sphagnum jensenii TaxID=128206 RepID=A0ABP0X1P1_9BRYO
MLASTCRKRFAERAKRPLVILLSGRSFGFLRRSCCSVQELHSRTLSSLPKTLDVNAEKSKWSSNSSSRRQPVVAVGISGGVDSSVAALLLKRQGYQVFGLYMRNWDSNDEAGSGNCTADQDYEDAQRVCKHLGIELFHVDYQKRYWVQVFESFMHDISLGLTPNPDLSCNQFIKFDALLEHAMQMGADNLATGHYARLHRPQSGGAVQLLRGADYDKDQSYFLASVGAAALERVQFPVGSLLKPEVRELAVSEGLFTASKRSSAGICFIGRRKFQDFIAEYVELKPGPFVSVDGHADLGMHIGIAAYTHGQRAGISGVPEAFYVAGKDVQNNIVFVAPGADHPALFSNSAVADSPFWISSETPKALKDGKPLKCTFKARYRQHLEECVVCFSNSTSREALSVRFTHPLRAVTPGQALVLYDGDVCLGASILSYPGPSLFEQRLGECNQGAILMS